MKLHGDTVRNYNKPINKRKRKATATITGKRMYTSNAVEVRHACDIAIGLCTERHGYDAPGGRLTVCWPCQEAAAEIVNKRTTQKAILERLVQHARATARSLKGE